MRLVERARAWASLRNFAPLTARSREGSFVRATGVVRVLDESVIAPLTGRECVLARSRVLGVGDLINPPQWMQIKPFVLVLEGSDVSAVIDGSHVLFGIAAEKLRGVSAERRAAFIVRLGFKTGDAAWLEEIVVAAGDRITVGGVLMRDLNPQPPTHERTFRQRVTPQLRLVGSIEHPLVIVRPSLMK